MNPFQPNYNATVHDLKRWDFELVTADDGMCVYAKRIKDEFLYFYLSFDDQCFYTTGQGVVFTVDSLDYKVTEEEFNDHNYESWFKANLIEFKKDSLKVVELLERYDGAIVSSVNRLGDTESLTFRVGGKNSTANFNCTYTAFPQNTKSIEIFENWNVK